MLLADTLNCHHLEHSICDTEETPESAGNFEDTDKLEEINQLLTSKTTTIEFLDEAQKDQDIHLVRMA